MDLSRTVHLSFAAALCAVAAVPAALAGGEPRNSSPFTRPSAGIGAGQIEYTQALAAFAFRGEPKNAAPFTSPAREHPALVLALRQISQPAAPSPTSEPKNGPPFTRAVRGQR